MKNLYKVLFLLVIAISQTLSFAQKSIDEVTRQQKQQRSRGQEIQKPFVSPYELMMKQQNEINEKKEVEKERVSKYFNTNLKLVNLSQTDSCNDNFSWINENINYLVRMSGRDVGRGEVGNCLTGWGQWVDPNNIWNIQGVNLSTNLTALLGGELNAKCRWNKRYAVSRPQVKDPDYIFARSYIDQNNFFLVANCTIDTWSDVSVKVVFSNQNKTFFIDLFELTTCASLPYFKKDFPIYVGIEEKFKEISNVFSINEKIPPPKQQGGFPNPSIDEFAIPIGAFDKIEITIKNSDDVLVDIRRNPQRGCENLQRINITNLKRTSFIKENEDKTTREKLESSQTRPKL